MGRWSASRNAERRSPRRPAQWPASLRSAFRPRPEEEDTKRRPVRPPTRCAPRLSTCGAIAVVPPWQAWSTTRRRPRAAGRTARQTGTSRNGNRCRVPPTAGLQEVGVRAALRAALLLLLLCQEIDLESPSPVGVGQLEEVPDAAGEVALEAADRFAGASCLRRVCARCSPGSRGGRAGGVIAMR